MKKGNNPTLRTERLRVGYGDKVIIENLDISFLAGKITAVVGANACGKSTLLRSLSRLLKPKAGHVWLGTEDVHMLAPKQLAQQVGLLPQTPIAPEGITVADLVGRGRHPHQKTFTRWSATDDEAVTRALEATQTLALADQMVDELSGGQRQRVWLALALAQETKTLLLDEPTTFLDVSHQMEVLDLLVDLNKREGTTVIMVLHDLNLAARYADCLIAMKDGGVHSVGTAEEVLHSEMVSEVFGINSQVIVDPTSGKPLMLPIGRHRVNALSEAGCEPVPGSVGLSLGLG